MRQIAVAATVAVALAASLAAPAGADPALRMDPLTRAKPEEVGLSTARLAHMERVLKSEIEAGRLPGAVVAIARKGRLAWYEAFGFRDKEAGAPMPRDAVFAIASMTKPLTSVAILMLYEDGRLFLADPVHKYLPQLRELKVGSLKPGPDGKQAIETEPAVRPITIQDLLRHTSGLTYREFGTTEIDKLHPPGVPPLTLSADEFIEALSKAPLLHQPGTAYNYSLSTDVLGVVVEKVAGKGLGEFLAERLFRPLGMADTSFVLSEAARPRQARALANNPLTGASQWVLHAKGEALKFGCGGACALSTAADYLRFAEMLRRGGTLDGVRILGRKTVELMTANHLSPAILANTRSPALPAGYGFGLGVASRMFEGVSPLPGSVGEFNWGGAWGTFFWADPKEELSVVFMAQAPGEIRTHYRQLMKALVLAAIAD
jgi:CubicO group peptidase (beta-lactamase class C family)